MRPDRGAGIPAPGKAEAEAKTETEARTKADARTGLETEAGTTAGAEAGKGKEPNPTGPRFLPRRPEGNRLHPITPWRRAWAPLAALLAFAGHDFERAREWSEHLTAGWVALGLAVLLPLAAAYGFLSWWCTSYLVTDTELRIHTGLLFRRAAHIRLDRIQAVDISRPLLARVVGVAKLKLDVVGTESKDELAFLGEKDAVALRAELLARAAYIAPEAAPEAGEAPSRALLRLRPRTLIVSVLMTGRMWALLAALLIVPVGVYFGADSVWPALASLIPLMRRLLDHRRGARGARVGLDGRRVPRRPPPRLRAPGPAARHRAARPGPGRAHRRAAAVAAAGLGAGRAADHGAGKDENTAACSCPWPGGTRPPPCSPGCCPASAWTRPSPPPCTRRAARAGALPWCAGGTRTG